MAMLEHVEWAHSLVESRRDREFEKEVRKALGAVPPGADYLTPCPWLARSLLVFNLRNGMLAHVDLDLSDLIWMVVSQENSCRYCYATHRALLRLVGFPEERIEALEQSFFTAELDPTVRLALDFARRISRSNPLPSPADAQPLRDAGYELAAVKELAFVAAFAAASNRVTTLPALPARQVERMLDRPLVKLLRPVIRRLLRSRSKRGRPTPLPAEAKHGPFAYLIQALDGLPVAIALRAYLDDAWTSPILSPRAKALVVAVVARGLGSALAEREALRLLGAEDLDGEAAEEILQHLGSPRLDPIETTVVRFARETIWYETSEIQRRARTVRDELSAPQFLELVGIASIANMLARLEIATHLS